MTAHQTVVWVILAGLTVFAIVAVLWQHESESDRHRRVINDHDEQLANLAIQVEKLIGQLEAEEQTPDDDPATVEFPALPSTEPMALVVDPTPAVQARRDAAWDETRPTPVPRGDSDEAKARKAAWVEEQLREIRARIDAAQGAS